MPRDLAQLLHDTAEEPSQPLAPGDVIAKARRRSIARLSAGAVGAVAALGLAAVALSGPLTRPASPDILGQPPEEVATSPSESPSPSPGLVGPPLPVPAPTVAPDATQTLATIPTAAPQPEQSTPVASEALAPAPSPAATPALSPSPPPVDEFHTCPRSDDPRVPAGSGCVSSRDADLDGDGAMEAVLVYALLDEQRVPTSWHLRSATSATGTLDLDITARVGKNRPARYTGVRRVGDVDADGRDEVLVELDSGASTTFSGLFTLDAGRLTSVVVVGSRPILIPLGGSVRHQDSMRCEVQEGRHLLVLHATSYQADGSTYTWSERVYGWSGEHLVLLDTRTGQGSGRETAAPDGCGWRV